MGTLTAVLGYHCLIAARNEDLPFFQAGLVTLPFTVVVLVAFVALGFVSSNLLLFASIIALFLVWLWWGLRSRRTATG